MAALGWQGMMLPNEYDGLGMTFLDLTILFEEAGYACLPGPLFSTVVMGSLPILELGSNEQKKEFLPEVTKGNLVLTMALLERSASYTPSAITTVATEVAGGYTITGNKLFVTDAHIADYIVCVARTSLHSERGISLFLIDSKSKGVVTNLLKTVTGDKQCEVAFNGVTIAKARVLGEINQGWTEVDRVLKRAAVIKCAEMIGGAKQVLEMSASYAKQREQFGRPIGSFQATQHHLANMVIDIEGMRFLTYKAAWSISNGLSATREVAMTKAWCSEAYRRITALGHQVHGGAGFVQDHDMPLYFRRARGAMVLFGNSDFHREVLACELGLY